MTMEIFLKEAKTKLECRDSQLRDLFELLNGIDEPLPSSIFISGCRATGKTACITAVLNHLGYKHAMINCVECDTPGIMYETILNNLKDVNCLNFDDVSKCDNMPSFIKSMNELGAEVEEYEPIVIVFDKAERLLNMNLLMPCMLRLGEFCNLNICTMFVTDILYENFYFPTGIKEPIVFYYPNYNKEEMFRIICLKRRAYLSYILDKCDNSTNASYLDDPELFGNYLTAFLSVFYRPCRDLIELQHMARVNFQKYCEPILDGTIKPNDLSKLWRHISPILKQSLETLYLKMNTQSFQSQSKENCNPELLNVQICPVKALTELSVERLELPYYAKYLLIAAYLSSYNPPKEDKRLFVKNHGKQRKRLQQVRAKAKISEKLNTQLGPKSFTLDRLLAIFYSILEERVGLSSNLMAQISSLVELKFLIGGSEIELDCAKYKCVVSYEFISTVAKSVGFNIRKYLYDFI